MNIDKLINAVHKRETLQNQKAKNHHTRFILDKLWDEVAKEVNSTRNVSRNKWKALRDKFRKVISSFPAENSDDAEEVEYHSDWPHFYSLLFIKDQFATRISTGNFSAIDSKSNMESKPNEELTNSSEILKKGQENSISAGSVSDDTSTNPVSPCITFKEGNKEFAPSTSRKRTCSNDLTYIEEALLNIQTKINNYLQEKRIKYKSDEDDDDLSFFRCLLPHIKHLSSYDKMSFRIQVMEIVKQINKPNRCIEQTTLTVYN